jgi:signal transduction histidine kinase/ActR/RegA family two-component response regulator
MIYGVGRLRPLLFLCTLSAITIAPAGAARAMEGGAVAPSSTLLSALLALAVLVAGGLAVWNGRLRRRLALTQVAPVGTAGQAPAAPGAATEASDLQVIEDALRFVAQKGWNLRDEDFLVSLVRYLGEVLDVDYAIIDKLADEEGVAETVAVYAKGEVVPNLRYALDGTPCANILKAGLCCYPSEVQACFPEDGLLVDMKVESYIGIPLWDSDNRVMGLIAIMDGRPLDDRRDRATSLLQIAATRTAAELERRRIREQEERQQSERLMLERHIQEARKLESLGKLAGGIAHDFNNMLGAVMGFAEFITETLTPEHPARNYASRILATCQRGKGMVDQILAFARRKEAVRLPVSLADLLAECQPLLQMAIPSSITVVCDIPADEALVDADRDQITQALMNLCFNARDAMEHSVGTLTLGIQVLAEGEPALRRPVAMSPDVWREDDGTVCAVLGRCPAGGGYAVLSVRDTGTGMDAEVLANAFDPFYTTKEKGKGTGLGLSVVHGTVVAHQGAIVVRSRPGQGTEVRIVLPLVQAAATPHEPSRARSATVVPPLGSALVVDDNRDFGEMLTFRLERKGWSVAYFSDPRQALEAFQATPLAWEVLISDQSMPHLRGNDLIRAAREIRHDLHCILCTGYDAALQEAELAALGPVVVLPKPLDPEALWAALTRQPSES